MDTRFWGPSGWRLLHLVSFAAPSLPRKELYLFFKNLPFVLPCKFCRASLTDYYAADPIPSDPHDYAVWLYRIHNRVNGKLREQKLLETTDPSWTDVKKQYTEYLTSDCIRSAIVGWDFLFSVAYTTPCPAVPSSPMPGAPPRSALPTPELRNRWGVIRREERLPYIQAWWDVLPAVLPFPEWRDAWKTHISAPPRLDGGRRAITAWLYATEKTLCGVLKKAAPHESYQNLCRELETFSSGCGKRNVRAKTCRAEKSSARKTLKLRRRYKYKASGGYL